MINGEISIKRPKISEYFGDIVAILNPKGELNESPRCIQLIYFASKSICNGAGSRHTCVGPIGGFPQEFPS